MNWQFDNNLPIYTQIVYKYRLAIASGEMKPGEKLAAVREIAFEASVNPNTMQRAFQELERLGLVYGKHGIMSPVNVADLALVTGIAEKPEPAVAYTTYTVVRGDCLWNIAKKLLGSGTRYKEIKTLNGLMYDTIYIGQVLKIPNR